LGEKVIVEGPEKVLFFSCIHISVTSPFSALTLFDGDRHMLCVMVYVDCCLWRSWTSSWLVRRRSSTNSMLSSALSVCRLVWCWFYSDFVSEMTCNVLMERTVIGGDRKDIRPKWLLCASKNPSSVPQ